MTLPLSLHRHTTGFLAGWRVLLAGVVLLMILLPPPAAFSTDWGSSGYGYRKAITISNTNVASTLTNFPLLVKFTADTGIGGHARSDGYDLRFTDAAGTSLSYEREAFRVSGGSGSGLFWVKVPSISSSANTTIYAYYGKSDATDGQNAANVWDANFAGVWHLNDGTTLSALDSTSNNNDGTNSGAAAAACYLDGGASFNGSHDPHDNIDSVGTATGSLNITGDDLTISAWANWNGSDLNGWIFSKMNPGTGSYGFYIRNDKLNIGMNNAQTLQCSEVSDESTCTTNSCTPGYTCGGTHSYCSTYGDESSCTTHSCTPNYADPGNCACNPPPTCACGNDTMNCSCGDPHNCSCGDPWNCGECFCESCGDPYNCACGDPYNCSCGNDTMNCGCPDPMNCGCGYQLFSYCSGDPHGCQQSECDASSDGCSNTYTGCSGGTYQSSTGWQDVGGSDGTLSANTWEYVTIVYDGSNVTYYIDGVVSTPIARTGNLVSVDWSATIGLDEGWTSQWFGGKLDEIRVSNSARSADWIDFEYHNQSGTNEISWESEEQEPAGATPLVILLVNTEAFQTIDDTDTASDVSLTFGETLNKSLSYNRTLGSFQFNDDLAVTGNVQTSGNFAASGGLVTDGNAVIRGTLSGAVITSATLQNICLDATTNAVSNIGTGSLALHTAQIRIPMKTATVEADGTNNSANVFIGSDAGVNAHQYYAIKTGESAQQDLTLKMKVRIPRDFADFGAGNDLSFWYKNTGASTSDSKSDILVEDKDGDDAFTAADGQGLYNAAWTEYADEFDGGSFNPAADEFLYVTVKGSARYDSGYLSPFIGEIVLTYRAR